ncbi:MAG: DUF427 domain-containing protein [Candidatus Limnocylindrales bacterium]
MSHPSMSPATSPSRESVWDYPRPPRIEPARRRVRVIVDGLLIADSRAALRVLETSHPPVYYVPPEHVRLEALALTKHHTFCEYKGRASYWRLRIGDRFIEDVAWSYPAPAPGYEALADHLAFYPGRVDEAWLGDERVRPQAGSYYGGWITDEIVGPFKGEPGSETW